MKQKISQSVIHKYTKSRLGHSAAQCVSPYGITVRALEIDGFKQPSGITHKTWVVKNYRFIFEEAHKLPKKNKTAPLQKFSVTAKLKKAPKIRPASTENSVRAFVSKSTIDPTRDEFLSSFEWRAVRMMALKSYGTTCQCCGASPSTGAVVNVDHIKPRKHFPDLALELSNLQILCSDCNHGKGNWDTTDWRMK